MSYMHRLILHNGEIREAADRTLSAGQVGLMNGWGVFSTIRVHDGVPFAWDRHWERMRRDAARLRVPFPESGDQILEQIGRLIEANRALNSTLRVMIVRNGGGMFEGPPMESKFDVLGFTRDVRIWGDGAKLGIVPNARLAASQFAGAKILSWAENLAYYERAQEQGLDEVILLNERGEVSECTSANIFVVKGSAVLTPPLSSGCLPGVTRAVLLEEIRISGIDVEESVLLPADLRSADEVFITSTTREVLPVISIDGVAAGHSRRIRDTLQGAFREYVQNWVAKHRPLEHANLLS